MSKRIRRKIKIREYPLNLRLTPRFFLFLFGVGVLAFLSLWRGLNFHFWRDDWGQLWAAVYRPDLLLGQFGAIRLHPGNAVEQLLAAQILGLNPFGWQLAGLGLRILSSLAVALMLLGVTGSRRTAVLAGLFFASVLIGLESFVWASAHTSSLLLLFFSVGLYFWLFSGETKTGLRNLVVSLVFLVTTVLVSPARSIFLLLLLPFWDFLTLIRLPTKKLFRKVLLRNFVLAVIVLFFTKNISGTGVSTAGFVEKTFSLLANPYLVKNFFYSIGNLLIGWIIPISETGSLANSVSVSLISGLILPFVLLLLFLGFLLRRTKWLQVLLFFITWIPALYFPNWLFDLTLVVGTSHRYLTLASVGLVAVFSHLISGFKNSYLVLVAGVLFILLNVTASNRVLASQAQYRSFEIVEALWYKIDADVPKGERNSIFMYSGDDYLRGVALDWSFSIPFGIRRGVRDVDDFPIVTGDKELIAKLICEGNVPRPSVGKWSVQKEKIPLSHLHAWELQGGVMRNISEQKRKEIRTILPCSTF